jgi:hypothetical protein
LYPVPAPHVHTWVQQETGQPQHAADSSQFTACQVKVAALLMFVM